MTEPPKFGTTFLEGFPDPRFAARAEVIPVPLDFEDLELKRFRPGDEIRLFWRVLKARRQYRTLLLFSSRGTFFPELLATILLGFLPKRRRPVVVLYGEMWEPNPGLRAPIERLVVRLVDRSVFRYVVYSEAETATFPGVWQIDPDKMRRCRFFHLHSDDLPAPPNPGLHVFAGGNSFRDYEPLIEAAAELSDTEFVICTMSPLDVDLPPNVTYGPVTNAEFKRLLASAKVVVVPLQRDTKRSAGNLTYFTAMCAGLPTIVSDALGVGEYIRDGDTGITVDGSPTDYVRALRWVLDPANEDEVRALGERAHEAASNEFTLEAHVTSLLAVMDEAQEEAARRRG
jgi:glycosyltransferase involved in cell wall biosynthesis